MEWTRPADLAFAPAHPTAGLGSHFGEGFLALSADSAAHFVPRDAKPDTLRALFTAAGDHAVAGAVNAALVSRDHIERHPGALRTCRDAQVNTCRHRLSSEPSVEIAILPASTSTNGPSKR